MMRILFKCRVINLIKTCIQQTDICFRCLGLSKMSAIIDLNQEVTTEEINLNHIAYNEVKDIDRNKHLAQTSMDNGTKTSHGKQ